MPKQPIPALIREREESVKVDGEVKTYFIPESFEWYTGEGEAFITISDKGIYISSAAAKLAGFMPGEKVKLGKNKANLAIMRSEEGFRLTKDGRNCFKVSYKGFIAKLDGDRGGDRGRVKVQWDGNMLVGRRSKSEDCDNREPRDRENYAGEGDSQEV